MVYVGCRCVFATIQLLLSVSFVTYGWLPHKYIFKVFGILQFNFPPCLFCYVVCYYNKERHRPGCACKNAKTIWANSIVSFARPLSSNVASTQHLVCSYVILVWIYGMLKILSHCCPPTRTEEKKTFPVHRRRQLTDDIQPDTRNIFIRCVDACRGRIVRKDNTKILRVRILLGHFAFCDCQKYILLLTTQDKSGYNNIRSSTKCVYA